MLLDGLRERVERGADSFVRDACIAEQQPAPCGVHAAVVARERAHDHARVERALRDDAIVNKLFGTIADRYRGRAGGYARVLKAGMRYGDAADMAVIELVDRDVGAKGLDSGPVQNAEAEEQEAA